MSNFRDLRYAAGLMIGETMQLLGLNLSRIVAYENGEAAPCAREVQILRGLANIRDFQRIDWKSEFTPQVTVTDSVLEQSDLGSLRNGGQAVKARQSDRGLVDTAAESEANRFMSTWHSELSRQRYCIPSMEIRRQIEISDGSSAKDLHTRATGKFYTPQVICRELADQVVSMLLHRSSDRLRVVDPFCGDGRLVVGLIYRLAERGALRPLDIHLWDCDASAAKLAENAVRAAVRETGTKAVVHAEAMDTFERAQFHFGTFDVVITNPPWETLKPDRRELSSLSPNQRAIYIKRLKTRDAMLSEAFPISQPTKKFSGWGTNLARVGTEIALRLCRNNLGICAQVSPASLLGDQVSKELREWLFSNFTPETIAFFPAEGRFFQGVDQPIVTISARAGIRAEIRLALRLFNRFGEVVTTRSFNICKSTLAAEQWTLPVQLGPEALEALDGLRSLPLFGELEGPSTSDLWAGRELDETERARYLASRGTIRFAKGRMISRYSLDVKPKIFVNPAVISIPSSAFRWRIAWRDVSRPNQKRRMHAGIIPPKWATGNSLHVAHFRDDDSERLHALLTIVNSIVFELQIRARLATAHISLGVVRLVRMPRLFAEPSLAGSLSHLARRCIAGEHTAQAEAEIAVARAYGLDRDSFGEILNMFPKLDDIEKETMLNAALWSKCTTKAARRL